MTVDRNELTTPRLHLRWMTVDDAGLLLAIWNDPAFMLHVGDRGIRTREQAEVAFREGPETLYRDYGYGPYRVALRDTGEAIGICGLFRREGLPDPDIGFAFLPGFVGRGFGGEAARAVVGHARDTLGLPRLTAIVSPGNAPSIALIEKLGLRFERMICLSGSESDSALYASDW